MALGERRERLATAEPAGMAHFIYFFTVVARVMSDLAAGGADE